MTDWTSENYPAVREHLSTDSREDTGIYSDLKDRADLDGIESRMQVVPSGDLWTVDDGEQTVRVGYAGEIIYDKSGEHPSEWAGQFKATAEFIAHAPTDIAKLLSALNAVSAMHARVDWRPGNPRPDGALDNGVCTWCGDTYPCPTTQTITAELKGSGNERTHPTPEQPTQSEHSGAD
jgi:hypothetical protein